MSLNKKTYENPLQKRILAVNDISGFGKCSLTVALPILSSYNIETVCLPTALLSTHTGGFSGYTCRVLTDDMRGMISHWKSEGIRFDGVYTGYMCGTAQVDMMHEIIDDLLVPGGNVFVDPVMGDGGKFYDAFSMDYAEHMKDLVARAHIITPNLTEAALLTDMSLDDLEDREGAVDECLDRLHGLGCKCIAITGVRIKKSLSTNTVGYICVDEKRNRFERYYPYVDAFLHGCGDVFASVLCSEITVGKDFCEATRHAAEFTESSILRAVKLHPAHWYGLPFEAELAERK